MRIMTSPRTSNHRRRMHAWLVALIGLSFFAIGLPEALLGASWPAMGTGLHAQLASVSFIAIVICTSSVASALFARRIVQRLGMGRTVVCSVIVAAVGCAGFALADGLPWLLIFAVPYGTAAGMLTASLNTYIAPRYAARHIDWLHATTAAGAMGGHAILGAVIALGFGWRHAYGTIALLLCVLTIPLCAMGPWKYGRRLPDDSRQANTAIVSRQPQHDLHADLAHMHAMRIGRRLPHLMPLLVMVLSYTTVQQTTMLWASSYMVHTEHMTLRGSGWYASLFFVGLTAGMVIAGFLARHCDEWTMIHIGETVLVIALIVMLVPFPGSWRHAAGPILLGLGCAPINPAVVHLVPRIYGIANTATVIGLQTVAIYAGTLITPAAFGIIAHYRSTAFLPWYLAIFTVLTIALGLIMHRQLHVDETDATDIGNE